MKKTILSMLIAGSLLFSVPIPSYAAFPENNIHSNYGVECIGCHEVDYMQLIGYQQIGIGGTMYRLTYRCTNCGATTFQDFYAR